MNNAYYTRENMGNGNFKTSPEGKVKVIAYAQAEDIHNFKTTGQLNYRGQPIIVHPETGERIKNKPINDFDKCFEVENVSWSFTGIDKHGKATEFKTASSTREREFRKENQNFYTFS